MGLRRTYQSSLLFRDLTRAGQPVPGGARRLPQPLQLLAASTQRSGQRAPRARAPHRTSPTRRWPSLSHGQQRQLEIGMALAGAPRLILFDEPAAGLSPGERAELVALLTSLPAHMGFILIEHDLDIALRVVDRVTVMHNAPRAQARHARPRSRTTPRCRRSTWAEQAPLDPRDPEPGRHYGRAHALQGVSLALDHGVLAVVGRNGMGKTTLCNAITGLVRGHGQREARRRGDPRPGAERDHGEGRRLRAAGTAGVALAVGRRAPAPGSAPRAHGRSSASTRRSRASPSARATAAPSCRAASSRCSRSRARCSSTRSCWSWTSPPRAWRRSSCSRSSAMLKALAAEGEISVLLIEQNLGVAIDVADTVDVMVNGRIARSMPRRRARRRPRAAAAPARREDGRRRCGWTRSVEEPLETEFQVLTVKRATDAVVAEPPAPPEERTIRGVTRWGSTEPRPRRGRGSAGEAPPKPRVVELPVAQTVGRAAYIAGTFDTKGRELFYLAQLPREAGRAHGDRRPRDLRQAVAGDGPSARGGAAPSERRARGVHRRPRLGGDRDGASPSRSSWPAARPRRPHLGRRLGRHRARHARDAPAADRRAQGHGVHGGVRRREALRRAVRHLHDVLGHRRLGHQPHLREGARERGARARRA